MLIRVSVIVSVVFLLASCMPAKTLTSSSTDTIRIINNTHTTTRDTIYRDTYREIRTSGDTVYNSYYEFTYHYHAADTIKNDSTTSKTNNQQTITITTNQLNGWQKIIQAFGYGTLGTIAALLIAGIIWLIIIKVK